MTVGLLFIWDEGWFTPYAELTLWHDLAVAFKVDLLIMVPNLKVYNFQDIKFEKYDTVEEALNAHPELVKVFLEPRSIAKKCDVPVVPLELFKHPENALYIFGNSGRSNIGLFRFEKGQLVVSVDTPKPTQIWSIQVASIVLYDRLLKSVRKKWQAR